MGESTIKKWQRDKYMPVYHYYEQKHLPLNCNFIEDAKHYENLSFNRHLPTLILHGINDETIPVGGSRDYSKARDWLELIELDSDRALGNSTGKIWQSIKSFWGTEITS